MKKRRNLKTFEQYLSDHYLMSDVVKDVDVKKIESVLKKYYTRLYLDQLLMIDVVKDKINENYDDCVLALYKGDFSNNVDEFYNSYNKSKRISFLTPYTKEELSEFNLFKLNGYNIGFAIKKNGEIILVHNNEPKIGGIGDLLIKKAIEFGGNSLDHFDGFLTGFYKKNGFKFSDNLIFDDKYAPDDWKYEPVDIYNEKTSIYVNERVVSPEEFENAEKRYDEGRVDVVYRKL
jgi:hypothetical protein